MKTRSVLLVLSLVTMVGLTRVQAQGFHLGIKGGANISKIDGQSFDDGFKFGYSLGAFAELNINKKWGLQPELLWNQSKTTTTNDFNLIYQGVSGQNVTLNYLSIPLLLTYRPIPLLSFQLGPQFGILMDQSADLFQNGEEAFKKGDFSILGGAQLNLGAFRAGLRYYIQLNNINDLPNMGDDATWKGQGFQLYVGIKII
ncbi:MAG TPA: porin family protein [Puia sp.]|nr:porin family protein [Puia sp.]